MKHNRNCIKHYEKICKKKTGIAVNGGKRKMSHRINNRKMRVLNRENRTICERNFYLKILSSATRQHNLKHQRKKKEGKE